MVSCTLPPPANLQHDSAAVPLGTLYDKIIVGREDVQRRYMSAHAGSSMLALRSAKLEDLIYAVAALLRVKALRGPHLFKGLESYQPAHAQALLLSLLSTDAHNVCLVASVTGAAQVRSQSSFLALHKNRLMKTSDEARAALRRATQPGTLITTEHMSKRLGEVTPHMPVPDGSSVLVSRFQERQGVRDDELYWHGTSDVVVRGEVIHSMDSTNVGVCSDDSNTYIAHAPYLTYDDAHNAHVQNERIGDMKNIKALLCTRHPMKQEAITEVEHAKHMMNVEQLQSMPGHFDKVHPNELSNHVNRLRDALPMIASIAESAYNQTQKALHHIDLDFSTLTDAHTIAAWTNDERKEQQEFPERLLQHLRAAGDKTLREMRSTCTSDAILLNVDTAKASFDILDDRKRYAHVNRIVFTDDLVGDALAVLQFMCNAGEFNWHECESYVQQAQRLSNGVGDKVHPQTKETYGRIDIPAQLLAWVPKPPVYSDALSRGVNIQLHTPHRSRSRSGVAVEHALLLRDQLRKEVHVSLLKESAAKSRYKVVLDEIAKLPPTKLTAFSVLRWAVTKAMAKHQSDRSLTSAPAPPDAEKTSAAPTAEEMDMAKKDGSFQPSATFQGAKASYEFRTGKFGTGYYRSKAATPDAFGSAPAAALRTTVDTRFVSTEADAHRSVQHYRKHVAKNQAFVVVAGQSQCLATQDAVNAIASHSDRAPILLLLLPARGSAARALCPDGAVPWVRTFKARMPPLAPSVDLAAELQFAHKAISPHRRYDGTLSKALRRVGLA